MKQGAVFLLVFGLANILNAAELGLDGVSTSELKEIEQEIAKGNVPPNYTPIDKSKRGVAKLTNADTPSFNHLTSTTSAKAATAGATSSQASPVRYVYNYPTNYYSYLQAPQHAAQIASQYAFQPPGVTHYLQTPTQIQYVTSPTASQLPTSRYQTINGKTSGTNVATSGAVSVGSTPAMASSQYLTTQQLLLTSPQSFVPQAYVPTSSASATTPGSLSQTSSQSQMSAYQTPQQYYYPQQPVVMLLVQPQPQPMAYIYPNQQQHAAQQMYLPYQHPLYNLFGGHRFALPYSPAQASQVTYLVPMAVTSPQQPATTSSASTTSTGNVEKPITNTQETSASNSFGLRTTKV